MALAHGEGVECAVVGRVGDFREQMEVYAAGHQPQIVLVACPPLGTLPLEWCQSMACRLRSRLDCPVVSLLPCQAEPWKTTRTFKEEVQRNEQ